MKNSHQTNFAPFDSSFAQQSAESFKDIWSMQLKLGQAFMEQSVRGSQMFADFAHTQMNETLRLSQETFKMGMNFGEEIRKNYSDITTKSTTQKSA
jgi:hypothetical protein